MHSLPKSSRRIAKNGTIIVNYNIDNDFDSENTINENGNIPTIINSVVKILQFLTTIRPN